MSERLRRYFYSLMTDEVAPAAQGPFTAVMKFLLSVFSLLYLCGLVTTRFLYSINVLKSYRPECKVISVGNITLGGTGKTPLVLAIARRLCGSGKKVVILSRGYKTQKDASASDEVEFFRKNLPEVKVLVGGDRVKTAKKAVESLKAQVILLDDGFQHWRLKRDIDIVAINNNNPFGNGRLIPRGILREPLSSLSRADIFLITKVSSEGDSVAKTQALKSRLKNLNRRTSIFNSSHIPVKLVDVVSGEEAGLSVLEGKKIALVCGIADPASFETAALSLGADIALRLFFMDHHKYSEKDIKAIIGECRARKIDTLITTQKDIPRLHGLSSRIKDAGIKLMALVIDIKIEDEERFFGRLYSIFTG